MLELDPYKRLPDPGETAMLEIRPSVAVIGAGISGMIAARLLAERGFPVTVFDKGRQTGGRASTRYEGQLAYDHGCQYFTARDRRFLRYVDAWREQGVVGYWDARRASCINGKINLVNDDVSRYVGVPGMNAITRHLALGLDVRNAVEITGLTRGERGWELKSETPIHESFELVVVSAPAPQAARLLEPVPSLAAEAAKVVMLPCWTGLYTFEYELDVPFDAAYFSTSALVWAANNGTKPGRSRHECWVMHATPSWSAEHIDTPPDQVAELLLAAFFESTGRAPVQPTHAGSHRWRYASPSEPLGTPCLWSREDWIGACGDWSYSARFEGAFLSGLALAERIINERPRSRPFDSA